MTQEIRFNFALVTDEARNVILAAGGQISKKRCCGQSWCGCQHYPDRSYDKITVEVVQTVDLYGDGCISCKDCSYNCERRGNPTGFPYMPLHMLPTGVWLIRRRTDGRFDEIDVCPDPEVEVQAWIERIEKYEEEHGCFSNKCDTGAHLPEPTLQTVLAFQQQLAARREQSFKELEPYYNV